jgi:serine/threonine-protein kinase
MHDTELLERLRASLADRYEVQKAVGEGGMALVFLARDIKHDRRVAVKVLRPELAASLGTDRFLREIRLAAQLQHPNILALYDSGEAAGLLFYVMPFVEGESLRDRLTREKQLPIDEAVMLVREAADALHFAHHRGVIHRDIKPENILISGGHALVADFGIARAVSEAGREKLTQTGMAVGTPHYMSPEQASGGEVDARSDVYSLGCVLYELLVGQPPFDGPTAMAILARHSLEGVPSMRVVRRTVPEELEEAVDQALEKAPADRFQSAAQFSEALFSVNLSTVSHRISSRASTSRLIARRRRQRRTRILIGTAVVVLAGAAIGMAVLRHGGQPATRAGPDPRSIAVLYFDSRGGGDTLRYLADGLTEGLIDELSQVEGLHVISRNGVRPFRALAVSPDSISHALNVGTLVAGTLAQSADRLRLQVSLMNARGSVIGHGFQLERPRGEIFALQDELARELSESLRTTLGGEVRLQEARRGTRSVRAWELVQQAEASSKDAETVLTTGKPDAMEAARHQLATADSILTLAAEADKEWAKPWIQRGWIAYRRCRLDRTVYDECTRGLGIAEDAIRRGPNDPDALELRGTLRYWLWINGQEADAARAAQLFADAEADFRASVGANPEQASAWTSLGHLLFNKPATSEAKLAAAKAYKSDPYLTNANVTLWRLFSASLDLEDRPEATHWCEEGQRRFPNDYRFAECQLWLFALKGVEPDVPKAWALRERYVKLSPPQLQEFRQKRGQMLVAFALIRAKLPDSARRVMLAARADASIDNNRELPYIESLARTMLGDKNEAFEQLTVYLAKNPQQARNLDQEVSWWTRDLRSDPRWQQLKAVTR